MYALVDLFIQWALLHSRWRLAVKLAAFCRVLNHARLQRPPFPDRRNSSLYCKYGISYRDLEEMMVGARRRGRSHDAVLLG